MIRLPFRKVSVGGPKVNVPAPVPGAPKAALAPFVVVLAFILGAGMVGQVALSTVLQNQSFTVADLRQQSKELGDQLSDLQVEAAETSSVSSLAGKASKLGMRPNTYPVQLELTSGKIIGKPTAVTGKEVSNFGYRTPEQLVRQRQAEDEAVRRAAAEKAAKEAKAKADAAAKAKAKADAAAAATAANGGNNR